MRFSRTAAVVLRQFYLYRGSAPRIVPVFAWVTIDIVVWGFISRYLNTITSRSFNFLPAFLGAVLLWDFFIRVMQGISIAFMEDVWSRNFLNMFASPLSISEYIVGLVVSGMATSAAGLLVMLAVSSAVFGLSFAIYGALLAPFLMVLIFVGIAFGILANSMVLRFGPAAEWFMWLIPAFIAPFAGVIYPLSTLPRWMQYISRALPPAYVFESMREILAGGPVPVAALLGGGVLALLDVILAGRVFVAVYRYAVRTGLIARYSAESLS